MSLPELLLILFVALIVFGPKQLPMVAKHIAHAIRIFSHLKEQALQFWHNQVKEWQLLDNEAKAAEADKSYHNNSPRTENRDEKTG